MSIRTRRTAVASAIALAAAATAAAMLPSIAQAAAAPVPALNGTKGTSLTISTGTKYVIMNGTTVNFGVVVRDLAWSPDGKKAAFIDGSGNLDVSNPDGTGRVTVAKNPGNETWSHPTWQVTKADPSVSLPAKNNLVFAAKKSGTTRLETVVASSHNGTPHLLTLGHEFGEGVPSNPTTGNAWPSAAGGYGAMVYDNTANGEIYIRDDYTRQTGGTVTLGSQPALSPNGEEIVFVRAVQGHDHIFVEDMNTRKVKDLTPHGTTYYTEPTWSPSGGTIAFRAPTGTYTIPANGSTGPVMVTSYVGLAAYRG